MVDITLVYAGLVGLRAYALDQHRTMGWQLSWPDEQNGIGLTSFVDVKPTKLLIKYLPALVQQMIAIILKGR